MAAEHAERADGVEFTYEDGLVTATDIETGVASCGETRPEALAMLSEALALHAGEGDRIEDRDAFLDEIGIDPASIPDESERPPWL